MEVEDKAHITSTSGATAGIHLFVRGRVCVVGEHSDWAGGLTTSPDTTGGTCLVYTTQCGVGASVRLHHSTQSTTTVISTDHQLPRLVIISKEDTSSLAGGSSSIPVAEPASKSVPFSCELSLNALMSEATDPSNYYSYMCGGVHAALRYLVWKADITLNNTTANNPVEAILPSGICIYDVESTMPERRGFSSSASISVLAVKAVLSLVAATSSSSSGSSSASGVVVAAAKTALECVGTCMELAWLGERLTGSLCGQMDQCVACTEHGFQHMSFSNKHSELCSGLLDTTCTKGIAKASIVDLTHVAPPVNFYFVVADLKAGKDTRCILQCLTDAVVAEDTGNADETANSYATTIVSTSSELISTILDQLQGLLGDDSDDIVTQLISDLRGVNRAHSAAIFLRRENRLLVQLACVCIARGSVVGLGAVMRYFQALFDLSLQHLCPELTSPKLHRILADEGVRKLSVGGKGVGSQGDGSVQFLCATEEDQHNLYELLQTPPYDCIPFKFQL